MEAGMSGHVVGDVGDLSAHDQAMLTEMLGAPSKKGALRRGFKVMPRILPYLRPYRKFAVISVILTILLAVVALAEPWPLAFVIDSIIGHKPVPSWLPSPFGTGTGGLIALAVIATLLLTALSGLMTVWNEYLSTTVDQKMVLDFRSDMFDHAQKLSLAFHDTESKGILMYRINNQASAMGQIVIALPTVAQSLLTVIGMAYISIQINPLLALLALGTTPFVVYSTTYYTNRIEPRLYRVRGLGAINLAIVYEAMSMIRVVLAFGTQRHEWKRFRQQGETFVDQVIGLTVRQTAFKSVVQLIAVGGDRGRDRRWRLPSSQPSDHSGRTARGPLLREPDLSAARRADQHDHQLPAAVHLTADVVRSDGHPARCDREAERGAPEESARRARARKCWVQLSVPPGGAEEHLIADSKRPWRGRRRADRRREVDARELAAAFLRRRRGQR